MDSLQIALHIDKTFPSPPLFPSGDASYALLIAVVKIMSLIDTGFRPLIVPRVVEHLDPRGQVYFHETRSKVSGKPLSEVRPTDKGSLDQLWKIIETESSTLIAMLRGRDGKKGPFFEGEKPGYADLVYAAQLAFIERFDETLLERCFGLGEGEIRALYTACLPWLEGQGEDREWPFEQGV